MLIALSIGMVRLLLFAFMVVCGWSFTTQRFDHKATDTIQNSKLIKKSNKTDRLERILAEQDHQSSASETDDQLDSSRLLGQRDSRKK